jgi:hypothetical protein
MDEIDEFLLIYDREGERAAEIFLSRLGSETLPHILAGILVAVFRKRPVDAVSKQAGG